MKVFAHSLAKIFDVWHLYVSPTLPAACRHEPSCSQYSSQALRQHGLWTGLRLSVGRISRCHPWGSSGYDPVPSLKEEPSA